MRARRAIRFVLYTRTSPKYHNTINTVVRPTHETAVVRECSFEFFPFAKSVSVVVSRHVRRGPPLRPPVVRLRIRPSRSGRHQNGRQPSGLAVFVRSFVRLFFSSVVDEYRRSGSLTEPGRDGGGQDVHAGGELSRRARCDVSSVRRFLPGRRLSGTDARRTGSGTEPATRGSRSVAGVR